MMRSFTHAALGALSAMIVCHAAHAGPDIPIGPTDSIQDTIDAAPSGARILLDAGVYTQSFEIIQTGKELTLEGAGPGVTILDGEDMRRIAEIVDNGAPVTLRGMTLRNGRIEEAGNVQGAALFSLETTLTIEDCEFIDNIALRTSDQGGQSRGGALFVSSGFGETLSLRISDCVFLNNEIRGEPAQSFETDQILGGAASIAWFGEARIERCVFEGNRAVNPDGPAIGGAFVTTAGEETLLVFDSCEFLWNRAESSDDAAAGGAGLPGQTRMINCLFYGNEAVTTGNGTLAYGGALLLQIGTHISAETELLHCTMVGNSVSGAANTAGGGVFVFPTSNTDRLFLTNTIITDNSAPQGPDINGDIIDARYSLIGDMSGATITGSDEGSLIGADPMFVDASGGDFRLSAGSPCIDAADTRMTYLHQIAADLAGELRAVIDPASTNTGIAMETLLGTAASDIGAYEFQPPACPADLTGSGNVGSADLSTLLGSWGPCP